MDEAFIVCSGARAGPCGNAPKLEAVMEVFVGNIVVLDVVFMVILIVVAGGVTSWSYQEYV